MSAPHLFEFLTPEEWKLAFAIQFVADFEKYQDAYPLADHASPGHPGGTFEESFRRVIRYLTFEHGYSWKALRPRTDGRIEAAAPICKGNGVYVAMLSLGKVPTDIPTTIKAAIAYAKQWLPRLDVAPLEEALHEVEASIKDVRRGVDPEQLAEAEKAADEALATLGITRKPEKVH